MSQYFDDFSGNTAGTFPNGWSTAGAGATDWEVIDQSGTKVLTRATNGSTDFSYLSLDDAGTPSAVEVFMQFEFQSAVNGSGAAIGLWGMGLEDANGVDGYLISIDRGFAGFRAQRVDDSSRTVLASDSNTSVSDFTVWNVRLQIQSGGTIQIREWPDSNSEPTTWNASTTDTTYGSGRAGIVISNNDREVAFYKVGIGTGGDPAPTSGTGGSGAVSESLALTATGTPSMTEQSSADETIQLVAGATPSVSETASATESVQLQATGSPSIIETLKTKVLEALGLTVTATPSVNETSRASESAQVQASGSPSITETASVTETLSVAASSTFSITETVGNVVLESLSVTASGSPSVSETASASESVNVTAQGLPSVDESATATENIETTATAAISVIEEASATEALAVAAKATFRIAEITGAVAVRRVSEIGRNAAKLLTGSGNDAEQL